MIEIQVLTSLYLFQSMCHCINFLNLGWNDVRQTFFPHLIAMLGSPGEPIIIAGRICYPANFSASATVRRTFAHTLVHRAPITATMPPRAPYIVSLHAWVKSLLELAIFSGKNGSRPRIVGPEVQHFHMLMVLYLPGNLTCSRQKTHFEVLDSHLFPPFFGLED